MAFFSSALSPAVTISTEERQFFMTMGERIAQLRKARSLTQTQLAETLGIAQQTLQAYEAGNRRIPVSALPTVARSLSVPLEELFGEGQQASRSRRGPVPKWQQHIEAISQLPRAKQRAVTNVIEAMLAQAAA